MVLAFSDIVEIFEDDGRVTIRHMNPHGGFYNTEDVTYEDDNFSISLAGNENDNENGMTFVDAREDEEQYEGAPEDGDYMNYFSSNRYLYLHKQLVLRMHILATILHFSLF
jgi:hypothetical protein